ncbi:MAG: hypothetical protein QOI12_3680 [Alphaproteobacteria bacterium]|nr:hypothetical protein [Alphaproteobacteria bacterium]
MSACCGLRRDEATVRLYDADIIFRYSEGWKPLHELFGIQNLMAQVVPARCRQGA